MIVKIPDDIYRYENKVAANFTMRQIVCIGISLVIIVPVFVLIFWNTDSIDLAALVAFCSGLPILMCATFHLDGQHLEQIVWYKYQSRFKYPQKRKYVMTNLYEEVINNQKEYDKFNENLIRNEEPQQKAKASKKIFDALAQKRHHTK